MTDRPVPSASRKRVDEDIPLGYDFTNDLPTGVTISSAATCTVAVASDSPVADSTPAAILSGAPSLTSPIITQKIINGTNKCKYLIIFKGNGSDGMVYNGECTLIVEDVTTD